MIAVILSASPNFHWNTGPEAGPFAGDFLQEWLGAYIVRAGDHEQFYNRQYAIDLQHDAELIGFAWNESEYLPIVYPPFYYVILTPLSYLSVFQAAWLWTGLMAACLVGSARLLEQTATVCRTRELPRGEPVTPDWLPRALPWILPAMLLFAPVLESLTSSQKGAVCLLILTATWLLLQRGRPTWAGVVFGLLAFKPQLVLVIAAAMCCKRQWRFVAGGLMTGAGLAGLSLWLGVDVCRQYVQFATQTPDYIQTVGYDLHKSHCLYGFFSLLLPDSPGWTRSLTLAAGIGVAVLLARLLRGKLVPAEPRFAWQFSGLVIGTVLLSPHLFTYDLTVMLLPVVLIASSSATQGRSTGLRMVLGWLLILLFALSGCSPAIALATGVQLTTVMTFVLLVVLSTSSPHFSSGVGRIKANAASA